MTVYNWGKYSIAELRDTFTLNKFYLLNKFAVKRVFSS
jgi:hypothetical protein